MTFIMNRSTWASGSAYVPSVSIAFWVARTRNGSGTRWVSRPIVTCRSCMTSSSALCTFAGARLISSASRRFVKTGPSAVVNPLVFWLLVRAVGRGGEEGVREDRAERGRELARLLVVDAGADEVGRHEVGRELDAPER